MTEELEPELDLEPGLHENVPEEQYHRMLEVSQSQLKVLRYKTPAHLKHEILNPKAPTPALELGRAVHAAILEPDKFEGEYVREIEGDGRKKEVREARAAQARDFEGATLLKATAYDTCMEMIGSVYGHEGAKALLADCSRRELTAIWKDRDTELDCRARYDAVSDDGVVVVDIKTTEDASEESFTRDIYRYGYNIQAAHYLDGAVANGLPASIFAIVAVEKAPPYCLCIYEVVDEAIDAGRKELRRLLSIYNECVETDTWPGYPSPVSISLPRYAWQQIEERVEE